MLIHFLQATPDVQVEIEILTALYTNIETRNPILRINTHDFDDVVAGEIRSFFFCSFCSFSFLFSLFVNSILLPSHSFLCFPKNIFFLDGDSLNMFRVFDFRDCAPHFHPYQFCTNP